MIHFKACPRCVGDMELRHEYGEWVVRCVQCGYTQDAATYQIQKRRPA